MAYKKININAWTRRSHFAFFKSSQGSVRLSLTQPLDVTPLVSFCRQHSLSFYYSLIFLVTQTANDISGFKQRIENGIPIEHPAFYCSQCRR
ncbi:CatA-like O-acetyltransferase [uncultured Shewanella sp.]|uniref:CatA-like O-acetyltransferase n=1 Tax=uncultured Shewanella sp. TaxID=173975 RepID=UPI00261E9230|nr:CatA-like O-acetyltransferase [uncultured Shewanella sp.]